MIFIDILLRESFSKVLYFNRSDRAIIVTGGSNDHQTNSIVILKKLLSEIAIEPRKNS